MRDTTVVHLDERRAKKFLTALATHPFITVVFDGEQASVFSKDIELDATALQTIRETLDNIEQEQSASS